MMKATVLALALTTAVLAQQQPVLATKQAADLAQNQNPKTTSTSEIKDARQSQIGKLSFAAWVPLRKKCCP